MIYADGDYDYLVGFVVGSIAHMERLGRQGPFMVLSSYDLGFSVIEGIPVTVDTRLEQTTVYVMTEEDYADIKAELDSFDNEYHLTEEQEEAARWN